MMRLWRTSYAQRSALERPAALSLVADVVTARYVVDTTGFADLGSFAVIGPANQSFVNAVREALPYMRFSPAKIGQQKVRQLVEQPFTFRITAPAKPE